ncbi:MAG: argininosuccinate synthase [Proteobacteria bacterium]|nr:MAG: argininosuccinate synthase [Pseudomonadota bacterium]
MKIQELSNHKIGLCVSGGLDSRTVAMRLLDEGLDVHCFTADLAQPDEDNIDNVAAKMATVGAKTTLVDLKDEMAEACFTVLKSLASYDGGYWNTTGIARAVTVKGLLKEMKKVGCTVLSHGATGRGNDQVRFERYTNVLAPEMEVYAPWRDPTLLAQFAGRKEMVAYLREQGVDADTGPRKHYSTDANLAGLSHEAEDLEELDTSCEIVDPIMGVWPQDAPDEIEEVTLRIEAGRCVAINGVAGTPLEIMQRANAIGGRNGIWMRNALENRIIGTKSRGVYEAPGMELIAFALRAVYQATMGRRSTKLFAYLSRLVADQVYDGRLYEPAGQAALAGIDKLTEFAHGTVKVGLYKGNMYFRALTDCPNSLYSPADASMEASDGLNPVSSQGFVEVAAVEARIMANAGQVHLDD